MAVKGQVVDVYKEGTQTDWSKTSVYLLVCGFLIQMIVVAGAYFLFDVEAARMAFLVVAAVDGLLLFGGLLIGVAYLFMRLTGKIVADHDRTDSEGDEAKIAAVLHGAAAITSAQGQIQRNEVNAEAMALKWMTLTQREANRLAEERGKKPQPTDDLLKHLLGSDEPLLLTEGEDE